jgi:hypothetical protein
MTGLKCPSALEPVEEAFVLHADGLERRQQIV